MVGAWLAQHRANNMNVRIIKEPIVVELSVRSQRMLLSVVLLNRGFRAAIGQRYRGRSVQLSQKTQRIALFTCQHFAVRRREIAASPNILVKDSHALRSQFEAGTQ
jgi:hypothetical protein